MEKKITILLVEDNEGDIFLTTEALEEGKIFNKIEVARDGKEAIDYLLSKDQNLLPDLILLDINLPRRNGLEVLKFVKGSTGLKHIPVIMLTTSSSEIDINEAYKNYANCYITKPVAVDNFLKVVASIENFWISIVSLPTK